MRYLRHAALTALAIGIQLASAQNFTKYVNPNIGVTHSRWFFYTPASMPFGMAKLSASTNGTYGNKQGWEAIGYQDDHRSIDGFPCFHEFQVGGVSLIPVVGPLKTVPGKVERPEEGFRSNFDKSTEYATAGYYTVILKDYQTKVELTATDRVGFQRYTFPATQDARILFNIGNLQGESGKVKDAYISNINGNVVEGYVITKPEYVKIYQQEATVPMYFYAVLSKIPNSASVFHEGEAPRLASQIQGKGAIMSVNFTTKENEQIEVKIGLSYTSIENARNNLQLEASKLSFDTARRNATKTWNEYLGRIEVTDESEVNKTKFYTGLYHALLGRGLASDVNGAYPKNDGTIGHIPLDKNKRPKFNHYNTDAMWGAYWNLTTLWAIAYPEYYNDFVNSQLLVYKDAGWLGDGIAASKFVSGVGTNMMPIVFAGAYNCGIRNYDVELAYEAAAKNELCGENRPEGAGKKDVGAFVKSGYVPHNDNIEFGTDDKSSYFSASHTLEYSFSAYAMAQWAKAMGRTSDHEKFISLSNGWTRLFDEDLKLIHPRDAEGKFIDNFDPLQPWRGFQEGNATQYTFFVPQNPLLLIGKVGKDRFNTLLNNIFTESQRNIFGGGKVPDAFSGLQTAYNQGNQPCLHIAWLFNFSGVPYLTQKWTHMICDEFYGNTGEHGYGYGQDEDQGQMGAWYVLNTLGLFDVQGGTPVRPTFQFGSPTFDKAVIKLNKMTGKGRKLIITTDKQGKNPYYVQSAVWNGKPLNDCWMYREELLKGGELHFVMGTEPQKSWGTSSTPACPQ